MFEDEVAKLTSAETSRRTIVKTGAKFAYAAPVIAGTMKLSAQGAGAASPVPCKDPQPCPNYFCGDNCTCVPTTEKGSICHQGRPCPEVAECDSSDDCPSGSVCAATCCGILICVTECGSPHPLNGLDGANGWSTPR